ncbi:2Fe-2S iron-sulfur cluster-binding protein [Streptomyces sp. NPDC046805]|uniref:2Fe-2S iron-sulfur cluster-binding protein n=1 Tax=Streptomyces sp. NPDC046805 TaxID=3155134 RepID=UPI0033CAC2CA
MVFVQPDGRRQEVEAEVGQSVMKAATSALIDGIIGECGGDLSCATCHVFVDEAWASALPECSDDEESMLDVTAVEPTKFSRLSCQIRCGPELDGITVHVPEAQR